MIFQVNGFMLAVPVSLPKIRCHMTYDEEEDDENYDEKYGIHIDGLTMMPIQRC